MVKDGAGIGSMKLDMPVGESFMFRGSSTSSKALAKIFGAQHKALGKMVKKRASILRVSRNH